MRPTYQRMPVWGHLILLTRPWEGQQAKCVADVIDYAEKKHPENILVFINIGLMDNLI